MTYEVEQVNLKSIMWLWHVANVTIEILCEHMHQ